MATPKKLKAPSPTAVVTRPGRPSWSSLGVKPDATDRRFFAVRKSTSGHGVEVHCKLCGYSWEFIPLLDSVHHLGMSQGIHLVDQHAGELTEFLEKAAKGGKG